MVPAKAMPLPLRVLSVGMAAMLCSGIKCSGIVGLVGRRDRGGGHKFFAGDAALGPLRSSSVVRNARPTGGPLPFHPSGPDRHVVFVPMAETVARSPVVNGVRIVRPFQMNLKTTGPRSMQTAPLPAGRHMSSSRR